MITKENYIQGEIEASLNNLDFIYELVKEHIENKVKDLNDQEFKEYLCDIGLITEEETA